MGMSLSKRLELAYEFLQFEASLATDQCQLFELTSFFFLLDSLKNQMTRLVERTRSIQDSHKPAVKKKILITVAIFSNALAYI